MGAVTPGATYFYEEQMRCITGLEKLMSQGIRYNEHRLSIVESQSDTLLSDIAGNAFAMCHVAAVQFVMHGILSSLAQPVVTFPLNGERDVPTPTKATSRLKRSVLDFTDSE